MMKNNYVTLIRKLHKTIAKGELGRFSENESLSFDSNGLSFIIQSGKNHQMKDKVIMYCQLSKKIAAPTIAQLNLDITMLGEWRIGCENNSNAILTIIFSDDVSEQYIIQKCSHAIDIDSAISRCT